jgi:hypothetical protein
VNRRVRAVRVPDVLPRHVGDQPDVRAARAQRESEIGPVGRDRRHRQDDFVVAREGVEHRTVQVPGGIEQRLARLIADAVHAETRIVLRQGRPRGEGKEKQSEANGGSRGHRKDSVSVVGR